MILTIMLIDSNLVCVVSGAGNVVKALTQPPFFKTLKLIIMEKINEFKKELKDLLIKYGAAIYCNVDGDTHGLSYEMTVSFGSSDKWKEYKLSDGAEIEPKNLS